MSIKAWPENERPREKMLNQGAEYLSDAELLAIFFRTGIKGKTAIDIARELLSQFGSLKKLIFSNHSDLLHQAGVGISKYTQIKAIAEISKRVAREKIHRKNIIHHIDDTKDYVSAQLSHLEEEVFACLFLDIRNQIIAFEKLFHGTLGSATVYPRGIAKRALYHNAAHVIFAHNHPSGIAEPSQADKELTEALVESLSLLEIRVLDHLVVGEKDVISFAEKKWL